MHFWQSKNQLHVQSIIRQQLLANKCLRDTILVPILKTCKLPPPTQSSQESNPQKTTASTKRYILSSVALPIATFTVPAVPQQLARSYVTLFASAATWKTLPLKLPML